MERVEIVIGSAVVFLVYLAQVARAVHGSISSMGTSEMMVRFWNSVRHRQSEKSRLDDEVEQEIIRLCTKNLMLYLTIMKHWIGATLVYLACRRMYGANLTLSYSQDCVFLAMFCILVGVSCITLRMNKYALQILVATVMVFLGVVTSTFRETYSSTCLWAFSLTTLVFRVLLILCHGSICTTLVWNSAYAARTLYMVYQARVAEENLCDRGSPAMRNICFCEAFILLFLVSLSKFVDHYYRTHIAATRLHGEAEASSRLLDLMCDTVVELDNDRCMSAHSPKLSALVALNETIDTKGFKLQRFMPLVEDKERFEDVLVASCGKQKGSFPSATHATLRDSFGSHFRVELYCVAFRDIDDHDRFYVGLQESRDVPLAELKRFKRAKKRRRSLFADTCRGQGLATSVGRTEDSDSDGDSSEPSSLGTFPEDVLLHRLWQRTDREAQKRVKDSRLRLQKPGLADPCGDLEFQCVWIGVLYVPCDHRGDGARCLRIEEDQMQPELESNLLCSVCGVWRSCRLGGSVRRS
eukprot:TRINITY_DN4684_c0_g2_i2.p1 TRINITY_DN4684_c0_g2~~TRINITY_DN4684_c0_g2_i2.p1  ORF type:complete len:525 (-),score=46.58 TRINITY_DN4684_c0_g2_i2:458-2032(-)